MRNFKDASWKENVTKVIQANTVNKKLNSFDFNSQTLTVC